MVTKHTIETTLGDDVPLTVEYEYTPGRESTDYYTPPEAPEIGIESVLCGGVEIISLLSDKQIRILEGKCGDAHDD